MMELDSPPPGNSWHEFVTWLRDNGVRPPAADNVGEKWTNPELANACGVALDTVKSWVAGRNRPKDEAPLLRAFFGSNPNSYLELRAEFSRRFHSTDDGQSAYHAESTVVNFWDKVAELTNATLQDVEHLEARSIPDARWILTNYFRQTPDNAIRVCDEARRFAYERKYGEWKIEDEDRFKLGQNSWSVEYASLLQTLKIQPHKTDLICVGIGSGLEGKGIYEEFRSIQCCDLSPTALKKTKAEFGAEADIVEAKAEQLPFGAATGDLYISLKTYSSSLFNVDEAVKECHRCLRTGGTALVSIPTGYFVGEERMTWTEGLSPTNFEYHSAKAGRRYFAADRTYPVDVMRKIWGSFVKHRFASLRTFSGSQELFVVATRT